MNWTRTQIASALIWMALTPSVAHTADSKGPTAALVLADKGTAQAVIVVPAAPTLVERYAAEQMAGCLSKMTGGTFRIVLERDALKAPTGPSVISIGRTALSEGLELSGPAWKRESLEVFRIVRRGPALILCGNRASAACDNGTLWAVYSFLESQGVGSYLPDPLGEVIPEKPSLAIGELDLTDAPAFEMRGGAETTPSTLRRYQPPGDKAQVAIPALLEFNRQGAARRVEFFHSYQYIATAAVRKEHPEWFADTRNSPHGGQPGDAPHIGYGLANNWICLSRTETRKLFIEFFRQRFRDIPDLYGASIAPDDYCLGDRCPCAECQRLMALSRPPTFTEDSPRSASDLHLDFVNAVAQGLEKEFPDRKLITLAYQDYLDAPTKIRVHRNVIPMIAPLRVRNELHPGLDKVVAGWNDRGAQELYWYGYILTRPPMPHLMGEWFRNYKRAGVRGVYLEFAHVPVMNALNGWLYAKLTWNPDADVNRLIDEYCAGLFGPEIGKVMRRYFLAAWESNPPLLTEIPALLAEAEALAGDRTSKIGQRVRFFKLGWELYSSSLELDAALKAGDISGARRVVQAGIAAAETLGREFPWAIRANVWLHNTAHMEYSVAVLPALEKLMKTPVDPPVPELPTPGPAVCLTNNADLPAEKRRETRATVAFDQPVRVGFSGANLFDGQIAGPSHNLGADGYPVWSITVDLGQAYQIDRAEICTGMTSDGHFDKVPIYIEVQTSSDGKEFKPVERLFPRTLKGFVRSNALFVTARYVRFSLASLNMQHAVSEVRIWGRTPVK